MTDSFENPDAGGILVVCTANVCRSPAAAALLRAAAGPDLPIVSAGTQALPGSPACPEASRWLAALGHQAPQAHSARPLDASAVRAASLVLTAARVHRAAVIDLVPAAQRRTFTLPQAARLSAWLVRAGAEPPDADPRGRLAWLAGELDAARGLVGRPAGAELDDLPDPHLEPGNPDARHDVVIGRLAADVGALARWFAG